MPKLKTNSGAKKRFKRTADGKYRHRCSFRNHILTKKSPKAKRQRRSLGIVHPSDLLSVQRMFCEK
ncbi:MAG: 50S ribosomal protein L35 [Gammaproteobacteria bacterium]